MTEARRWLSILRTALVLIDGIGGDSVQHGGEIEQEICIER